MRYRISYYDQTFSKLYLRSFDKDDDGYFNCLVFWGTDIVSIPVFFDFQGHFFVVKEEDKENSRKFYFGEDKLYFVEALTVNKGKGKDFPEVDKIEILEDTLSEAIVEFID